MTPSCCKSPPIIQVAKWFLYILLCALESTQTKKFNFQKFGSYLQVFLIPLLSQALKPATMVSFDWYKKCIICCELSIFKNYGRAKGLCWREIEAVCDPHIIFELTIISSQT